MPSNELISKLEDVADQVRYQVQSISSSFIGFSLRSAKFHIIKMTNKISLSRFAQNKKVLCLTKHRKRFRSLPTKFVNFLFVLDSAQRKASVAVDCTSLPNRNVLRGWNPYVGAVSIAGWFNPLFPDVNKLSPLCLRWNEQREYMNMSWNCGKFLATVFVLVNLLGQVGGVIMVLGRLRVQIACGLLFFIVVLQVRKWILLKVQQVDDWRSFL